MIKEQLENNENIKPNTKLLNLLKANFPDYFDKDNNFMSLTFLVKVMQDFKLQQKQKLLSAH